MWFEFDVCDAEGRWGAVAEEAADEAAARKLCQDQLAATEVFPNGSLMPGFTLVLISTSPTTIDQAKLKKRLTVWQTRAR